MDRGYVVSAVARKLSEERCDALVDELRRFGCTLQETARRSRAGLEAVEIRLRLPPGTDPHALKRSLFDGELSRSLDLAVQDAELRRRRKRLVVMDMDSTLIAIEVIDELARAHGVVDRVAPITESAMRGEIGFDQSLRARVALLAGLDASVLEGIAASLPLSEGAETLVRGLKEDGCRVAVVSGGFETAAFALRERLGLDHAFANRLEVRDGKLTGKVVGEIVDAERKAATLEALAGQQGLDAAEVVAIGDGANDILMLQKAGLGVAFRGKARLRMAADAVVSSGGLDSILLFV